MRLTVSAFYSSYRCLAIKELEATGHFEGMRLSQDEDEHSIEMHLPYIRKIFHG